MTNLRQTLVGEPACRMRTVVNVLLLIPETRFFGMEIPESGTMAR